MKRRGFLRVAGAMVAWAGLGGEAEAEQPGPMPLEQAEADPVLCRGTGGWESVRCIGTMPCQIPGQCDNSCRTDPPPSAFWPEGS